MVTYSELAEALRLEPESQGELNSLTSATSSQNKTPLHDAPQAVTRLVLPLVWTRFVPLTLVGTYLTRH